MQIESYSSSCATLYACKLMEKQKTKTKKQMRWYLRGSQVKSQSKQNMDGVVVAW